jgi:hypothetical protein
MQLMNFTQTASFKTVSVLDRFTLIVIMFSEEMIELLG